MFDVWLDRFDHDVESTCALDLASYAVDPGRPDELGFSKVMEPVNALGAEVLQQEHWTSRVFPVIPVRLRSDNGMITCAAFKIRMAVARTLEAIHDG
jgi:hypothetical protein